MAAERRCRPASLLRFPSRSWRESGGGRGRQVDTTNNRWWRALAGSGLVLLAAAGVLSAQQYEQGIEQASIRPEVAQVAFVLAGRLWISPLEGGSARLLQTPAGRVESPVLSPDGSVVIFLHWSEDFHRNSLRSIEVGSGRVREVFGQTLPEAVDFDVDFTRRQVLIRGDSGLLAIPLEGGKPTELTQDASDRIPRLSPDGKSLAFVRTQGDSIDIWVLNREDQGLRRIQSSVTVQERFDWSADGSAFVLESLDTGNPELWVLPLAGGAARRITDDIGMEQDPTWGADGRIYFHRNRRLWSMQPSGAEARVLPIRCALPPAPGRSILIRGGRILELQSGDWVPGDVLVESGRISRIGANLASPGGIQVVDAGGAYLLPGLLDLHTHYEPWMGPLLLRKGVLVARDLGSSRGTDWILDERQFVEDGHLSGPQFLAAGVVMNGSGPGTIGQIRTEDPQLIARTVEWLADQGVDLIKIGSENTSPMLEAVIRSAHLRGLPVWGHIALVPTREAVRMGQDGIEHLRGSGWYSLDDSRLPAPVPRRLTGMRREGAAWWNVTEEGLNSLARAIVEAGSGLDPTLTVMSYLGLPDPLIGETIREQIPPWVLQSWEKSRKEGATAGWGPEDYRAFSGALENQRRFVRTFRQLGGVVTTGSDIGVELVVPGLSIHQEMGQLVAAGLTPLEAIRAATIDAARAAGIEAQVGTLDVGKWGNVVILNRDPLLNIEDTQSIRSVVNRGLIVFGGH